VIRETCFCNLGLGFRCVLADWITARNTKVRTVFVNNKPEMRITCRAFIILLFVIREIVVFVERFLLFIGTLYRNRLLFLFT